MRQFLLNNREDLIARCKAKVAQRPTRAATAAQLANGVPMFLEQLIRTLGAEEHGRTDESLRISGSSSGDSAALSEIGVSAAAHGGELLRLGFTVDAVVHDYGDLCQVLALAQIRAFSLAWTRFSGKQSYARATARPLERLVRNRDWQDRKAVPRLADHRLVERTHAVGMTGLPLRQDCSFPIGRSIVEKDTFDTTGACTGVHSRLEAAGRRTPSSASER